MITKPKGCYDLYGMEAKKWEYLNNLLSSLCEKYNYKYIRTPIFENSEVFHRAVGETSDIVSKETYDFKDRGERMMTLRPEGTAGVVRSYIENKMYGDTTQPVKLYYNGTMYRYERPQSGRNREFTQFGVEVLGSDDPMLDAEVISFSYNIFKILGLGNVKVKINSLGDKDSRDRYREALINYFKPHIGELCEDCKNRLEKNPLRILDCKVDNDLDIMKKAPVMYDYLNDESKKRFEQVKKFLSLLDVDFYEDYSIVRGLDYYNHTVFEVEASIDSEGKIAALGGGGRYNGLVEMLGGPQTSGIGFAIGLDRISLALDTAGIKLPIDDAIDVFVMYVSETEKEFAITLVQELRMNGFSCDTEYTGRGLKGQFKQADRLNSKMLIILNDEDLKENMITIKNNITKEEEKVDLDYMLYFLDEKLASYDECDCGCESEHNHENCNCNGDCHCHHND